MTTEKAYKLLALQENISNRAAKDLIDRGVVSLSGQKVLLARADVDVKKTFKIQPIAKAKILFEDDKILAVDKPAFLSTEEVAKDFQATLLHRLDKETSGVLLFTKDEEFHAQAIKAFKNKEVKKEYIAVVCGKLIESLEIDKPLITLKKGNVAYTKVSKQGKEAITYVEPLMLEGHYSKVLVFIQTGRTHQIRAHLKSANFPILGDTLYGGKPAKRVMLHAHKIALLGYEFTSKEPKEFAKFI
ncbi:MAG: RNA pseudouridine synthase [Sulfurospirillum sp.]|nr:RNA pseudouridine synthase [Sulfurospirillum sp.]